MAPHNNTNTGSAGERGVTMTSSTTAHEADEFLSLRAAWVAKGRPADPTDPYWASVLASQDAPRPTWVAPLVTFG